MTRNSMVWRCSAPFRPQPYQCVPASQSRRNMALDGEQLGSVSTHRTIRPAAPVSTGISVVGAMAYDATTGSVVLVTSAFGSHFILSHRTWTFDCKRLAAAEPATAACGIPHDRCPTQNRRPEMSLPSCTLSQPQLGLPVGLAGTSCAAGSTAARALPTVSAPGAGPAQNLRRSAQDPSRKGRRACARIEWDVSGAQPCFGRIDGVE